MQQILQSCIAVAGVLVGVLLGGWLTLRNQRALWLLDNKRSEYRKLFTVITRDYSTHVVTYTQAVVRRSEMEKARRVHIEALNIIRDRLFIAKDVHEMKIATKWSDAIGKVHTDRDIVFLRDSYDEIAAEIQARATKLIDDSPVLLALGKVARWANTPS